MISIQQWSTATAPHRCSRNCCGSTEPAPGGDVRTGTAEDAPAGGESPHAIGWRLRSDAAEILPQAANPVGREDLFKPLLAGLQKPLLRQREERAVPYGSMVFRSRAYQDGENPARPLQLLDPGGVDHLPDGLPRHSHGKRYQRVEKRDATLGLARHEDSVSRIFRYSVEGVREFLYAIGYGDEKIAPEVIGECPSDFSRFATAELAVPAHRPQSQ